jgi:hypothetical protein
MFWTVLQNLKKITSLWKSQAQDFWIIGFKTAQFHYQVSRKTLINLEIILKNVSVENAIVPHWKFEIEN